MEDNENQEDENLEKLVKKINHEMNLGKSKSKIVEIISKLGENKEYVEKVVDACFKNANEKEGGSYLKKHWHGQFSLAKSYWVNYNLILISFAILYALIIKGTYLYSERISSLLAAILLLVMFIANIWSLVGLWRSANNHIIKYNKTFWATIVQILVVLGWIQLVVLTGKVIPIVMEYSKIALNKDDIPTYNISIMNNHTELEISGGIKYGLTDDVNEYFQKYPNIKVLHLNSGGGRISEAKKLSNLIKDKAIITYSSTGCASACVDIFIAGEYRLINKNANLGFHSPGFPGLKDRDLEFATNLQEQFYVERGVEKSFVKKAFSVPHNDMWKPSHTELLEANVITKVIDGSEFAATEFSSWQNEKKLASSLLKTPLYQTIKIHEPEQFSKIVNIMHNSIKKGKNKIEMFSKIRKVAENIYLQYIPYSSDNVLLDVANLMILEMKILYDKEISVCYDFMMGKLDSFNPDKYFTKELISQESKLMNKVIITGAAKDKKIPNEKNIENIQMKVYKRLYKKIGEDFFVLEKIASPNIDKKTAVTVTIKLFEEIMLLKDSEKIPLLRFMFSKK